MPFIVGSNAGGRRGYSSLVFGAMPADLDGCSKVKTLSPLLVVIVDIRADWELSAMMHDLLSWCLCIEMTSTLQHRWLRLGRPWNELWRSDDLDFRGPIRGLISRLLTIWILENTYNRRITIYDFHHPWIDADEDKQYSYTRIAAVLWSATIPWRVLELLKHSPSV